MDVDFGRLLARLASQGIDVSQQLESLLAFLLPLRAGLGSLNGLLVAVELVSHLHRVELGVVDLTSLLAELFLLPLFGLLAGFGPLTRISDQFCVDVQLPTCLAVLHKVAQFLRNLHAFQVRLLDDLLNFLNQFIAFNSVDLFELLWIVFVELELLLVAPLTHGLWVDRLFVALA